MFYAIGSFFHLLVLYANNCWIPKTYAAYGKRLLVHVLIYGWLRKVGWKMRSSMNPYLAVSFLDQLVLRFYFFSILFDGLLIISCCFAYLTCWFCLFGFVDIYKAGMLKCLNTDNDFSCSFRLLAPVSHLSDLAYTWHLCNMKIRKFT